MGLLVSRRAAGETRPGVSPNRFGGIYPAVPLRTVQTALAVVAAATAVGCGASEREPDATATAERFQAALDEGDAEAACAQLSEETTSKLEQQGRRPCEQTILELELPAGRSVERARVYVTSAVVGVAEGGTLFLNEAPAGWEVSAAGCRPTAPELPLDCELEH
jgi:hypothetical protein